MPALKIRAAVFFSTLTLVFAANAKCRPLAVEGFTTSVIQNGIKVNINKEKTATLAVRCQDSKISTKEALNEFGKVGPYKQLENNVYVNERESNGIISRNYLKVGDSIYQVSLVVNSKNGDLVSIQKKILHSLGPD